MSEDQKTIPMERFKEVNDDKKAFRREAEANRLEAEHWKEVANRQPLVQEKPKLLTKEQLEEKVKNNEISEKQAEEILNDQFMEQVRENAKKGTEEAFNAKTVETRQEEKFKAYRKAHPGAFRAGSEQRAKVKEKFDELVADGSPSTTATELIALESVLGSPTAPKASETPGFSGGRSDADVYDEDPAPADGMPKEIAALPNRYKTYYKMKVDAGDYTWDQAKAEAEYINPEKAKKNDALFGSPKRRK